MRFTPHDYQRFAIDFIKEHTNAAVFLDMGLGKTVITLTALDDLLFDSFEVSRVLVVCPLRVAKTTWPQEIAKWDHLRHLRYSVVVGTPKERVAALGRPAELYIINRENVEWLVKHYAGRKLPFDMLVIDELSSFKNSRAKRFLALKKVLGQFTRVVGLTGTPAPNGLEDLWPQIYLLDRGARLGRTMRSYLDMYFDTPNSWLPYKRELKPGAEEAIYQRISDICVSMRAADHLKMPERVDNVVEISLSSREEKLYRQMERDMLLPYADGDVLALNAASLAGKLLQLANGAVYDEFHNVRVLHDRKLDALEDLIEAANGKPVLVMYNYQHDLTRIQQRFGKYSPENPNGVRELKPGAEEAIYRRISDICVSMRAADHLKMPERVDNVVEISLSPREEKLYRQMERDMLLPYADGDVLALNAASLAGKLLQLANGAVYDEFHNVRVLHDRKLDALEDLVEAANGKPVLVMYNYQHDLTRIQQRFGKYSPENPNGVRELKTAGDMEDWNAGRIPVAATQPASTGHGLNLQQGGSTIVWFGLNWSLELYEQANARLWRQGQKETVVVHHLVVKGTMDEQVMQALKDKAAGQNALMVAVRARIKKTKED